MFIDKIESQLRNKPLFDLAMPKIIMKFRAIDSRQRLYDVMSMRLGHTAGRTMKWKDIAMNTFSLNEDAKPVSTVFCQSLYRRGLAFAAKVFNECNEVIEFIDKENL